MTDRWWIARRHGLSPERTAEATARRTAGDLAGACAAARVDLLIDLAQVRRSRGAEVADRLAVDLRHLAPDLIRWHAPRAEDGRLAPDVTIMLARYGRDVLYAGTPRERVRDGGPEREERRPQRLTLEFGGVWEDGLHRWDDSPHLWDARAAGNLFPRIGGADRLPFHAPDGRLLSAPELPRAEPHDPVARIEWASVLRDEGRDVPPGLVDPFLQHSPDLELLRRGRLTPQELHPLVRAALFPHATGPFRLPVSDVETGTLVRCGGVWHPVGWRDGRIDLLGHTPAEAVRERAIYALGAEVPRCFTVEDAWRTGKRPRLPKKLQTLRRYVRTLLHLGDDHNLVRLLDAGLDPAGDRYGEGRGILHLMVFVDRPDLVARLVEAGADVNARDAAGRTPLSVALHERAGAVLVRALLAAGARANTADDRGLTPLHLMRGPDPAAVATLLRDAGADLEATDADGLTPLFHHLRASAPAGRIRALLAAGASPDCHALALPSEQRHHLDRMLAPHLEASS